MSRATLKDVAAHAGVSYQTVSNVLNDHRSVRPTTRERVIQSIRVLDYHPNQAAKALREARITTLCCVFYGYRAEDIHDPYHNLIQSAFILEAYTHGYSMTTAFLDGDSADSLESLRQAFMQGRFGGAIVVITGTTLASKQAQMFKEWGLPCILFDHESLGLGISAVTADYTQGIFDLVNHHVAQGRTRLTLLISKDDLASSAITRRDAYIKAVQRHGLPHQIVFGEWSFESGENAFYELWNGANRPDALLCANDRMAAGAILAARKLGVQVPQEIAISGFDDFEFARYTAPSLTTIRVPYDQMARQALRTLLGILEDADFPTQTTYLPVSLVVRESS
jgi:LacI family transcriptional regulator